MYDAARDAYLALTERLHAGARYDVIAAATHHGFGHAVAAQLAGPATDAERADAARFAHDGPPPAPCSGLLRYNICDGFPDRREARAVETAWILTWSHQEDAEARHDIILATVPPGYARSFARRLERTPTTAEGSQRATTAAGSRGSGSRTPSSPTRRASATTRARPLARRCGR